MPLYKQEVHDEIVSRLETLGVEYVLGERLALPSVEEERAEGKRMRSVTTKEGKEIKYDLLVSHSFVLHTPHSPHEPEESLLTYPARQQMRCTGQKPNSHLLGGFIPDALNEWGFVKVKTTTQVDLPSSSPVDASRIFAIGDVSSFIGSPRVTERRADRSPHSLPSSCPLRRSPTLGSSKRATRAGTKPRSPSRTSWPRSTAPSKARGRRPSSPTMRRVYRRSRSHWDSCVSLLACWFAEHG